MQLAYEGFPIAQKRIMVNHKARGMNKAQCVPEEMMRGKTL